MEQEQEEQSNISGISIVFWIIGFLLGLNDLADWLVVGSIPIIGDIFDVFVSVTAGLWIFFQGGDKMVNSLLWILAATFVELIPFGDLLPSYIITGYKIYKNLS